MTLIDQAKQAIIELADLTDGFSSGSPPDPMSVLGYESKIIRLHALLGEEMSRKFGNKERRYLERKVRQAERHEHGRLVLKRTSKDAEELAFRDVQTQYAAEVAAMEEYELFRALLRSLQNSLDFARSVVSFLRRQEEHSPDPQP